jgi:hypothetical protein
VFTSPPGDDRRCQPCACRSTRPVGIRYGHCPHIDRSANSRVDQRNCGSTLATPSRHRRDVHPVVPTNAIT